MESTPLSIEPFYTIEYTKKLLGLFNRRKRFHITISPSEFMPGASPWAKSDFDLLGIHTDELLGCNHVTMRGMCIGLIHLFFYVARDGERIFRILDIKDIVVEEKLRRLKIGSKLIRIMEDIGRKNGVEYITGTLEGGDDLESRKNFFVKNGFQLKEDPGFHLSHICAMKSISI